MKDEPLQERIEEYSHLCEICYLLYEKYARMFDDCSPDLGQISVERVKQKADFWKKEMEKAQEKLGQLRGKNNCVQYCTQAYSYFVRSTTKKMLRGFVPLSFCTDNLRKKIQGICTRDSMSQPILLSVARQDRYIIIICVSIYVMLPSGCAPSEDNLTMRSMRVYPL